MARPLAIVSAAWMLAILAAIAGVALPSDDVHLSLALFAFAVGLGLLVAVVLVADGLRHRRARRRSDNDQAQSALGRLEYLPAVTTGTRRIRWHGAQYRMTRRPSNVSPAKPEALVLQGSAKPPGAPHEDITVSAAG